MSDDDLIRRGDALALFPDINDLRHMNVGHAAAFLSERRVAIRAIPATDALEAATPPDLVEAGKALAYSDSCVERLEACGELMRAATYKQNSRALRALIALATAQAAQIAGLTKERNDLRAAVKGLVEVLDKHETKGPLPDTALMFCWLAAQNVRAALRGYMLEKPE